MRSLLRVLFATLVTLVFHPVAGATAQEPFASANEKARPGVAAAAAALANGSIPEQQRALVRLGTEADPAADKVLSVQVERYRTRELPPALWLELFEAVRKRDNAALTNQFADVRQNVEKSVDPLAQYQECLNGGDADAGRVIFMKRPEAGCVRCHAIEGLGGWIGPNLTLLRHSTERINILESIIVPNAVITPGYDCALLKLNTGEEISGVVSSENEDALVVTSVVDGSKRKVAAVDIVERTPLPSPMPPGFGLILSKRDIRDLVEFLSEGD